MAACGQVARSSFHFWFSHDGLCPIQAASFAAWVGKHAGRSAWLGPRSEAILTQRPLIRKDAMNSARPPGRVEGRGLPLIHDGTVDEWGTSGFGVNPFGETVCECPTCRSLSFPTQTFAAPSE